MVSLFPETTEAHADITYLKAIWGLTSIQFVDGHNHGFINHALHNRKGLQFEDLKVTLVRQSTKPPVYVGNGFVFVHALEGQVIYGYGQREFTLNEGDSLSLDVELSYSSKKVIIREFTLLTIQPERRRL